MTKKQVDMETAIGTGWSDDLESALLDARNKGMNPTDKDESPSDTDTNTEPQSLTVRVKNAETKIKQLLASLSKMQVTIPLRFLQVIE